MRTLVISPNRVMLDEARNFFITPDTTVIKKGTYFRDRLTGHEVVFMIVTSPHDFDKFRALEFNRVMILADQLLYRQLGVMGVEEMLQILRSRQPNAPILRP